MHSNRTVRLCSRYVCCEGFMVFSSDADSLLPLGGLKKSEPDESDFAYDFITYDPVKTRL